MRQVEYAVFDRRFTPLTQPAKSPTATGLPTLTAPSSFFFFAWMGPEQVSSSREP